MPLSLLDCAPVRLTAAEPTVVDAGRSVTRASGRETGPVRPMFGACCNEMQCSCRAPAGSMRVASTPASVAGISMAAGSVHSVANRAVAADSAETGWTTCEASSEMPPRAGVPANSCVGAALANDTDSTRSNAIVLIRLMPGNRKTSRTAVFKLGTSMERQREMRSVGDRARRAESLPKMRTVLRATRKVVINVS